MNPPRSLNRNRDFQLLWSGQALSTLGSHISWIAFPLFVLTTTGSAFQAGLVGFVVIGTGLVATLPGGVIADRYDRKSVMLVCDLGRVATMLLLAAAVMHGSATLPFLVLVGAIDSVLGCAFVPAATATLRRVVPAEQLPSALARNQARSAAASMAGPLLGGALFALSPTLPFLVDALSYAASFACVLGIRRAQADTHRPAGVRERSQLTRGLAFLWSHPYLRYTLANAAVVNFVFGGIVLVAIATSATQGDSSMSTGLIITIASAGTLTGSLLAPTVKTLLSPRQVVLSISWVSAALVPMMALAPSGTAVGILLAACCMFAPIGNVVMGSTRMALTPNHLQGRVQSATGLVAGSAAPLGPVAAGLLLDHAEPTAAYLVFGAFLVALALFSTVSRGLRVIPNLAPHIGARVRPAGQRPPA
jgi:predicted MFS family arabinose efflux permease